MGVVSLVVTAIWYGTRLDAVTIETISVAGGETIDHDQLRDIAQGELEGEYLGLIPRRFAYLYPEERIRTRIAELERVHSVRIARDSGQAISITFDEYLPHALWCTSVTSDECLFLSEDGFAFTNAPRLDGGSFKRFVHLGEDPEADRHIVSPEEFRRATELIDLFTQNGWYISHIELDRAGDAFLHVVGGGELKVALSAPPATTVENLLVVLTSDEFVHIAPGNFAYIDLRFGSKVFVNEELAVLETEAATTSATTSASTSSEIEEDVSE